MIYLIYKSFLRKQLLNENIYIYSKTYYDM